MESEKGTLRPFSLRTTLNSDVFLATTAALTLCLLIRVVARRIRPLSERRKLLVFALSPRTRRQWWLKSVIVLCACVAEESAYRGVAWQILSYSTGQHMWSAVICSAAFAFAHWVQGWISILMIYLLAVVMHGLVEYTNSLLPAMLVHGIFDFIAIALISKEASQYRQNDSLLDLRQATHE
ncbi:MAG: CPBP family intramembrane metalloprotease [Planctomycetaceae bacterium]|nr:CPBP family intramembrane metalloprotease [Planctomycetaceae bacterium]